MFQHREHVSIGWASDEIHFVKFYHNTLLRSCPVLCNQVFHGTFVLTISSRASECATFERLLHWLKQCLQEFFAFSFRCCFILVTGVLITFCYFLLVTKFNKHGKSFLSNNVSESTIHITMSCKLQCFSYNDVNPGILPSTKPLQQNPPTKCGAHRVHRISNARLHIMYVFVSLTFRGIMDEIYSLNLLLDRLSNT